MCGERLSAGYVDQPPGIALVARLASALFGTDVAGLRLLPWLAAAATVWLAGRLARRLGAGAAGAVLASAAAFAAPILLGLGHYLTMNAFEPLLVVALALVLARLEAGDDRRLWVAAGALAGLAVLFKYTAALLALALLAGLLATADGRRALRSRWAIAGAAAGLLAVLPNLAWQLAHGLPFLELVHNGQLHKNAPVTPPGFLLATLRDGNPLAAPLWVAGLLGPLLLARARAARFVAIGGALDLVLLLATRGKPYYFAPALPLLFAAGAAAAAPLLARRVPRVLAPALLLATLVPFAPLALPLLPEPRFLAWQGALGLRPRPLERLAQGDLPQIFADQHGWRELARAVEGVVRALPPDERARALVFGQNYGEAAAIDVYGPALGLPPAISGHNQYFLWGAPAGRGDPLVVIGDEDEDCGGGAFREKVRAAELPHDPWVMPYEDRRVLWICRGATRPLAELWPRLKLFI